MLSFGFLVLVFGVVCRSLDPQPGDAEGRECYNNRLNSIERVLSGQETLIRQLHEAGTQQSNLIRLQEGRLSHQENLIRQLSAKLARQVNLFRQQEDKLSRQEILIGQQADNYDGLLSEFRKLQLQLRGTESIDNAPKAVAGQRDRAPAAYDVQTRSDDLGSMEAVVSQLSQQVTEIQALQTRSSTDIQMLKASDDQQKADIQDASTSTFVQWGSSTCAANSTLIYSGVVGGSDHQQSGAAANYLCLTLSPVLLSTNLHAGAYLFGGEYQTSDSHMDMDPVCAVCRSTFPTTVMIPGTNVCTHGWHKYYSGYLMAGHSDHTAASEFICVDSKLDSSNGSGHNDNGKLLYYVRTRCGSLPCTPYVNDKIVTCVVCSK